MEKIDMVCLVDDDKIFQIVTQKLIESTNLVNQVVVFSNGLETLDFLKSAHDKAEPLPEVILLDLAMPIIDGWEFLEAFKKINPKLRKKVVIFVISSSINPADLQRAKSIDEVTDFIIKPITREMFFEMVTQVEATFGSEDAQIKNRA